MCGEAPDRSFQLPLRGLSRAVPVEDLDLELRVSAEQRNDFD
jgi:hypothetical protein